MEQQAIMNNENRTLHQLDDESDRYSNRTKKRTTTQQQQLVASKKTTSSAASTRNASTLKRPVSWTKRWSQLFSVCNSERTAAASVEMNKTNSTIHKSNQTTGNLSQTTSHQHRHQPIEKVNQLNSGFSSSRDQSRRYSNPFLSPAQYEYANEQYPTRPTRQTRSTGQSLSRSTDRLSHRHHKSSRRELRYEEHNDYIPLSPPSTSLNSIQCQPTTDHYARNLNQSPHFSTTHRLSQIEFYQFSSTDKQSRLSRPYSSNLPLSSAYTTIPITYTSTQEESIQTMSQRLVDNEDAYGRLSECHSPLAPLENSAVKAPRRIESAYSQFPTSPSTLTITNQEPIYANTQSLYDNILYPNGSKMNSRVERTNIDSNSEKRSCASQTQLTWTMATFSSFVDLENSSIVIPQTDPSTLHALLSNYHTQAPPSASPNTIDQMRRLSPNVQQSEETRPRSRTPTSAKVFMIEKRDGCFQTLLTIAPAQDLESGKHLYIPDSTPSPLSTGSSSATDQAQQQQNNHHHHHHHRHHRRQKSRTRTNRPNISTRDVGLQVNIQTVKKITFSSERSDESSATTSPSQATVVQTRESKNVQTNTESSISNRHDRSTSYENDLQLVSSSSQTLGTTSSNDRQTRAAQTSIRSLRDQSIETNNHGLFVCDLSSLLKSNLDEISPSFSSVPVSSITKRKN